MKYQILLVDVSHAEVAVDSDLVCGFSAEELHHLGICESLGVIRGAGVAEHVGIDLAVQHAPAKF